MKTTTDWVLPAPPKPDNPVWLPVVRIGRHIPFGYFQDPDDKNLLQPIEKELILLEEAKKHLKKYSLREVAHWLSKESGREISHEGLRKRLNIESKRQREFTNARLYAEKAKAAAEKAQRIGRRIGGQDTRVSPDSD
jgi:hypothetical protein